MKRTPIKRKSTLTRKPLAPGVKRLRRTGLKRQGKRMQREKEALEAFSTKPHWMRLAWTSPCSLCKAHTHNDQLHAHHLCSRSRGVGHREIHNIKNRAWLCAACHGEVHRGLHPELIRGRDFLYQIAEEANR